MYKEDKVFLATIKERVCLNPGSEKKTFHIVIDLEGSGIKYSVGDCLGIYPENEPFVVKNLIKTLGATGEESVEDRQGTYCTLSELLLSKANLLRVNNAPNGNLTDFCKNLPPLLPRFYSIASSMSVVGNEAHLTVGLIDGTCSHYLCNRAIMGKPILPIFHQPARHFSLPPASFDKPIMMIGPGTGIAPFRGFMQERISQNASAKNWLFFGERYRKTDFYYQSYWEKLVIEGKLNLDCAFSRDQEERIYVQHKIVQNSAKIWGWLKEGAYLFVCGDASKMARDVDKTLLSLVENEGQYSTADAKIFIKELKQEKRYQRDVY